MTQTISLQLPPGVVRSATPAATAGRWFDANLVRWHGGGLQPIGGWERVTATPLNSTPRRIHTVLDNSGIQRTVILCDQDIYIETASEYFDATPTDFSGVDPTNTDGGYGDGVYGTNAYGEPREPSRLRRVLPFAWSIASWGNEILMVASSDGRLLKWSPATATTKAAAVSGAPTNNRAVVVTNERHAMCIGSGGNPRRLAWSSREDYTDWNFSSTTNTAGFLDIDADGPLVGMAEVRDGILIFSETDVWLVRYVGLPFVYGVEKLGSAVAPISPQAVAVYEGKAVWLCRHAFWGYESGSLRPIKCDVEDYVFNNLDRENGRFYMSAGVNGVFPEVWWFYPDGDAEVGRNNRYLIWNYVEGWWSIGAMDRTCMAAAGVYRYPRAADSYGNLYQHEAGWLAANASRIGDVYAESYTLSLGDGDRMMAVHQAQPDSFMGADATLFKFFARQSREGAETEYGPISCRADGYMDLRLQGRDLRLRVEAAKDTNWTVGKMRLTVAPRGRR